MTNEEAIKRIESRIDLYEIQNIIPCLNDYDIDVLKFVIKALSQDTVPKEVYDSEYFARKEAEFKLHELYKTGLLKDCESCKALEQEPCDDAISRQAVIDALDNHKYSNKFCEEHHIDWSINLGMAHIAINDLPPVRSQQKTGRWIDTGSGQECSECGEIQYGYDSFRRFCASCGIRMVEPQESEE